MKLRILPCLLAVVMVLSGCGSKSASPKETFYLLKEFVAKNDDGDVIRRTTYDYDDQGLIVSYQIDLPEKVESWDEELLIYVGKQMPCDGVADIRTSFAYDHYGSLIGLYGDSFDGEIEYKYTYDDQGRVQSYQTGESQSSIELEYGEDGIIRTWTSSQSREETPGMIFETAESFDRVTKITFNEHEAGTLTYFYEYDSAGRLTESWYTQGAEMRGAHCEWAYDQEGRLISRIGLDNDYTFQYEGSRLTAVNGQMLQYSEGNNGEMVVTCGDCELTYEAVELTKEEIQLARYRWNQLCGIFHSVYHGYDKGLYGVRYPVFDVDVSLLLPRGFCY